MEQTYLLVDDKLVLFFDELDNDSDELIKKVNVDGRHKGIFSTFYLTKEDQCRWDEIYLHSDKLLKDYEGTSCFVIGRVVGKYIKLEKKIFRIEEDFYISKDLKIDKKYFYKYPNISVIRTLSKYANSPIWIDSNEHYYELEGEKQHISEKMFKNMLKKFPNPMQMHLYKFSEIDKILKDFFDTEDYSNRYKEYVEKRQKLKDEDFFEKQIANFAYAGKIDLERNETILTHLNKLLKMEVDEKEWQKELLPFIRLLFPQYIYVIDEIGILNTKEEKRRIDYILIDYDGNVDIIELKVPQIQLLKKNQYRYNFIESTDLAGSIMQCEKYLDDLTSHKKIHEERIEKKIREKLIVDYKVHINRPHALIIAGRTNDFDENQKKDFQVIKRKYTNIVDIISYDDLTTRLLHMIESVNEK